jgi:NAD(P)-dependent dehydrogenase (short-subunit alcohol dehydrogenase family)
MDSFDTSPVPDVAGRLRMDGRRFVVLGGGYGTGRQAAHQLASLGAGVFVVDVDGDRARRVAAEIGPAAAAGAGDATDRGQMAGLFAEAGAFLGGVDGVVDVIGVAEWGGVLELSDETWARQHDITLRHAFLALQLGGAAMVAAGGGTAVFVASVSGLVSSANHAAYGAGKAGLLSLVRSAAEELGPLGVRVNAVVPGSVATPRVQAMREAGLVAPWQDNPSPIGPPAGTADIAAAVVFLSSDLASQITGQGLVVDGGRSIATPFPGARRRPAGS